MSYAVMIQIIDEHTSGENVENYGKIEDYGELYEEGFAKEFCDGQTSPTPPRWADDNMGLLHTHNRETAEFISKLLRDDVARRVRSEGLRLAVRPEWLAASGKVAVTKVVQEILDEFGDEI